MGRVPQTRGLSREGRQLPEDLGQTFTNREESGVGKGGTKNHHVGGRGHLVPRCDREAAAPLPCCDHHDPLYEQGPWQERQPGTLSPQDWGFRPPSLPRHPSRPSATRRASVPGAQRKETGPGTPRGPLPTPTGLVSSFLPWPGPHGAVSVTAVCDITSDDSRERPAHKLTAISLSGSHPS